MGLGVGFSSHVVPTYLGEVAPRLLRGKLVGLNSLLITGGQLLAYIIGASLYKVDHGWRYMAASGSIPALAQLLGLFALNESPRWDLANGKVLNARRTLERIYPQATTIQIDNQIDAILNSLKSSSSSSNVSSTTSTMIQNLKSLFLIPSNRKPLILSCGLMFAQQATGFNSLMYFSSPLLLKAGFKSNPTQASILIALANFVGTAITMKIVDRVGRRKLLLRTILGVVVGLFLLGWSYFMLGDGDEAGNVDQAVKGWAWVSLISVSIEGNNCFLDQVLTYSVSISSKQMVIFTFSYSLGLGIVPWLVQSEGELHRHLCFSSFLNSTQLNLSSPIRSVRRSSSRSRLCDLNSDQLEYESNYQLDLFRLGKISWCKLVILDLRYHRYRFLVLHFLPLT